MILRCITLRIYDNSAEAACGSFRRIEAAYFPTSYPLKHLRLESTSEQIVHDTEWQ